MLLRSSLIALILIVGLTVYSQVNVQQKEKHPLNDSIATADENNVLTISAELKTRSEIRYGYKIIPRSDTSAAFFTNQRTRINFDFRNKNFNLYVSLQDARVWGQQDIRLPRVPSYLFEAYAEPRLLKNLSLRIGRQRVIIDNQRLFAENDWRVTGASHDAARLIYRSKKLDLELAGAFNQSTENFYSTVYSPNGFYHYKGLFFHYLVYKMNHGFTLSTLQVADGYQGLHNTARPETYYRFTNGGRIEFARKKWYLTFSGYYQHGRDSGGITLSSYYIQPEIRYSGIKNSNLRLGLEYLSGGYGNGKQINHNFVPLYGVAHRFMGHLDFFTSFPEDVNGAGLVNPYLHFQYLNNKWDIRIENHLFYTQQPSVNDIKVNRFLGFENDLRTIYKPNKYTEVEAGFAWAAVTKTMSIVQKGGNSNKTPVWGYLGLKFFPLLGKITSK